MSGPAGSSQWMYNAGDYEIDNSLRIGSAAASGLARNGNDSRNGDIFTISFWIKRSILGTAQILVTSKVENSGINSFVMTFTSADKIQVLGQPEDGTTGADSNRTAVLTSAVFRDTSAWYHIVYRQDTTQGTASNRHKLYVNGVLQSLSTNNALDQNTEWKYFYNANNYPYAIANDERDDAYADFYMAEHHYTDGVSNGPEAFGETGDYGEWKPIVYAGSHGTYGHYLKFNQTGAGSGTTAVGGHDYTTGTSSTIGADSSGNDHHFHVQGYATHDHVPDTPTNNFCTVNPIDVQTADKLLEGSLQLEPGNNRSRGTMGVTTGKWYFEVLLKDQSSGNVQIGIAGVVHGIAADTGNEYVRINHPSANGNGIILRLGGTDTDNLGAVANGNIIGVAFDMGEQEISFLVNNSAIASDSTDVDFSGLSNNGTMTPHFVNQNGRRSVVNFGQDSSFAGNKTAQGNQDGNGIGDFFYAPPSGFLALCSENLPEPAVIPSEYFNTVLWTGDGSEEVVTGVGFQPDWIWVKARNAAVNHKVFDAVRGLGSLRPNTSGAEDTNTSENLTSYNSDGFTMKDPDHIVDNRTVVAWNWKAGNATLASNAFTQGSLASTCSRSVEAGFSIVSYTGTGSATTIGHGLSAKPEFIVTKSRSDAQQWGVQSGTLGAEKYLLLDTAGAVGDASSLWNDTEPTASVFTVGTTSTTNANNESYIAYCFHSVDGYSKIGSYFGNSNADGTFVYTGFRPAVILLKAHNSAEPWAILDTARDINNEAGTYLTPNSTAVEDTGYKMDFLSNGFKLRGNIGAINTDGYIYLAFAETPFKYSNAR